MGQPAAGGQLGAEPVFAFTNEVGRVGSVGFLDAGVTPVSFLSPRGTSMVCQGGEGLALLSWLWALVSPGQLLSLQVTGEDRGTRSQQSE